MSLLRNSADTSRAATSRSGDASESEQFVIGGWTEPDGDSRGCGSVLLGVFDRGALRYAGHAVAGYDEALLESLYSELAAIETKRCPYHVVPAVSAPVHWVRPRLVAEVKVSESTRGGSMRQPVYLGLRADVRPEDCVHAAQLTRVCAL